MFHVEKWAKSEIERLTEALAVRLHSDACDECRAKYYEIKSHMEKLSTDVDKRES